MELKILGVFLGGWKLYERRVEASERCLSKDSLLIGRNYFVFKAIAVVVTEGGELIGSNSKLST